MESFYGGRQGASFVIKGAFKYITDAKRKNADGNWEWVDPYFKDALNTLEKLKINEGLITGQNLSAEETARLPVNPDTNSTWTSADWQKMLDKETMSIWFNNYEYKDIWYGEYCIIDPKNKNNTNNGKIFRRTLKGAGDDWITGGVAEYIGQIVGPAGKTPNLRDMTGVDANEDSFQSTEINWDTELRFINQNEEWDETRDPGDSLFVKDLGRDIQLIPGNKLRTDEEKHLNYYQQYQYIPFSDDGSGFKANEKYYKKIGDSYVRVKDKKPISNVDYYTRESIDKDYVQTGGYNWYDVRLQTPQKDISEIHLGFDFPYYVTDFIAGDALPDNADVEVIKQINTVAHPWSEAPFYEKYKINIPHGLRGGWLADFKVVERESNGVYYLPSAISYALPVYHPLQNGQKDSQNYPTVTDPYGNTGGQHYYEDRFAINSNTQVPSTTWPIGAKGWVATFYWRTRTPEKISGFTSIQQDANGKSLLHKVENIFLGLSRDIKNIYFSDTGTLTFEYDSWDTYSSTTQPGDNAGFNTNGVKVNGQSLNYTPQWETWIKKVDWITKVETVGTPSVRYEQDPDSDEENFNRNSVTEGDVLKLTFNNNTMSVIDDNGVNTQSDKYQKNLKTIAGIKLFDDGTLRIYRSDGTINNFYQKINWITSADVTQSDDLIIKTNNRNIDDIEHNLRLITKIKLNDNGVFEVHQSDGTIRSSEQYNDEGEIDSSRRNLGPVLNWITGIYFITGEEEETSAPKYSETDATVPSYHLIMHFNNKNLGGDYPKVKFRNSNNWYDFGLISNTQNGMFFGEDRFIISYEQERDLNNLPEEYQGKEDNNILSFGDKYLDENYPNGLDGKAIIATLVDDSPNIPEERRNAPKKVIYYYARYRENGEEKQEWRVLDVYGANKEGLRISGIFTPANKILDCPWEP